MYFLALKSHKENLLRKLQDERDHLSPITLRGWETDNTELMVPSELLGQHLSANDISSGYCPTDRDLYLRLIEGKPLPMTWARYRGKAVHKIYEKVATRIEQYISSSPAIGSVDIVKFIQDQQAGIVQETTNDLDSAIGSMNQDLRPSSTERQRLLEGLGKIVHFESRIAGSLVDSVIASKFDVNVRSEFANLFPLHVRELTLSAAPLGFSANIKPDLIINSKLLCEIKTGEPREFHRLDVAAYALAYEYETQRPMDFGIVFNVNITHNRQVPDYRGTEFFVISDKYRRALIANRNRKFEMLTKKADPGEPTDPTLCSDCPYFPECRE